MAEKRLPNVTLENVRIGFRNFSGKEGTYNKKGDRNFAVFLDPQTASDMEGDGWAVKYLQPREEGDLPQAYLKVKVQYSEKARPPRVVLITSRGRTELGEDEINVLDYAEIRNTDLIIRPYAWDVQGKQGISAYCQSVYVTIIEDALELKYGGMPDVPDSAQNTVGYGQNNADEPPWN